LTALILRLMLQIWFRLGLCSRPNWGSSQYSRRPHSWNFGGKEKEKETKKKGKETGGIKKNKRGKDDQR